MDQKSKRVIFINIIGIQLPILYQFLNYFGEFLRSAQCASDSEHNQNPDAFAKRNPLFEKNRGQENDRDRSGQV